LVLRRTFRRSVTFGRHNATFHLVKTPPGLRAPSLFWVDTWLIRRKLAEIAPDVVHAWGTDGGAAAVAARLDYPCVLTMQGIFTWLKQRVRLNRYQRLMAWLEDRHVPRAPLVTAESAFAVHYLQDRYPGLRVRQVEHAPKWLFHQVQRHPQRAPLRFLFVGHLSHLKGADLLLQAFDRVKDETPFELVMVGPEDTGWLSQERSRVSPELWSRVQFKGQLPADKIAGELSAATIMVYPTRADTSPNVVKEAVVAGLPVLASSVGGIVDYVWPDKNGILFSPDSLPEVVSAIRSVSRHPLFALGAVEPEALARARKALSPALMADKFVAIYRELAFVSG
jgi:glycosyltransferase involved in cell wall biosynthesis